MRCDAPGIAPQHEGEVGGDQIGDAVRKWRPEITCCGKNAVGPSRRAEAQQIVEVDDADDLALLATSSAEILRLMHSSASATSASGAIVRGERVITSSTGVSTMQVRLQVAAQVAVGDDADQRVVIVEHADAAEALGRSSRRSPRPSWRRRECAGCARRDA